MRAVAFSGSQVSCYMELYPVLYVSTFSAATLTQRLPFSGCTAFTALCVNFYLLFLFLDVSIYRKPWRLTFVNRSCSIVLLFFVYEHDTVNC